MSSTREDLERGALHSALEEVEWRCIALLATLEEVDSTLEEVEVKVHSSLLLKMCRGGCTPLYPRAFHSTLEEVE